MVIFFSVMFFGRGYRLFVIVIVFLRGFVVAFFFRDGEDVMFVTFFFFYFGRRS